jgi:hypothetical protein
MCNSRLGRPFKTYKPFPTIFPLKYSKNLGELQLRNFRMLTRGLVAIICYFDTHRFYLQILKMLLILKSSDEDNIPTKMKDFINNLIADQNLFNKLISK